MERLVQKYPDDSEAKIFYALALNTTAFQAEIYRAGLNAIPAGQVEAARMLGIGTAAIRRRILVPQTIRLVLPAIVSEIVIIIKNSSLVSVIAVTLLMPPLSQTAVSMQWARRSPVTPLPAAATSSRHRPCPPCGRSALIVQSCRKLAL